MNEVYVNKHLKRDFGEQDGKANFRLVYTKGLMEQRMCEVRPKAGGIEFPSYLTVEERPKYQYLPDDYWVVEKLYTVTGVNAEILPGIKFSYEPIFVFKRPDNTKLPVSEDAVMAIVHTHVFHRRRTIDKEALNEMEAKEYERQVDYLTQFLMDECSPMALKLKTGRAVVNAGTNNGGSDNRIPSSTEDSGV